jgi:hypothetical protein
VAYGFGQGIPQLKLVEERLQELLLIEGEIVTTRRCGHDRMAKALRGSTLLNYSVFFGNVVFIGLTLLS